MLRTENGETIYTEQDITQELLDNIFISMFSKGSCRKRKKDYYNDFITMDIETSTIGRSTDNAVAFTYSIAVYIREKCFLFRTWQEYNKFIAKLKSMFYLSYNNRLVCYVHNLAYEFQFMRDFVHVEDMFATIPRKVVKFYASGIEYRCSYKLTNMGLEKFTKQIPNVKHNKLSGSDFDYFKVRTPSTELTPAELDYIYNDVAGLYEALDYTLQQDKHNMATVPLTSTGYVRNELRHNMAKNPLNRLRFRETRLDQMTYGLLREARRGGNTHCNPVYSNMIVADLASKDMSSAYPAVMVQKKFPMTPFREVRESRLPDFERYTTKYACILDLTFTNIEVKTLNTIPYIAKAHCTGFPKLKTGDEKENKDLFRSDNGRVLRSSTLSMVITDIDYKIIKNTYKWDSVKCNSCYISQYDYLPNELRNTILKQYRDKTTLKGVDDYLYMKQKNKFNANFGCMLTDICQDDVEYIPNSPKPFRYTRETTFQEQLDKYYSSENSFLSYQHGVWVTAWCRWRLQRAIDLLGYDMVYNDTDSVKFFKEPNKEHIFNALNAEIFDDIRECGFVCTIEYNSKKYTLGLWEDDGDYKYFKSLGAKKYCYIDTDDNFEITVAGLSKTKARNYLLEQAEKLDKDVLDIFGVGTIVPQGHSGRTTSKYNDYEKIKIIDVDGEKIQVGSNTVIEDTTYKFTITEDYETLITDSKDGVMF